MHNPAVRPAHIATPLRYGRAHDDPEDAVTRRADLTTELRDRATHVLDRAEDVRERAPELAEELRPVVRRTEIRALSLLQTLIGGLLFVPRVVVRVLGVLADAVDEVVDRGGDLVERGREVADTLPEARSTRRRRRVKSALWVGAGFAAGFVTGWLVAQRQAEALVHEAEVQDMPAERERTSPNGSAARPAVVPD